MSLCLLFGGCVPDDGGGAGQDTTGGSGNQSTPTEAYEALIAQLQQELLALQEEHLQESEEYQARIDELRRCSPDRPEDRRSPNSQASRIHRFFLTSRWMAELKLPAIWGMIHRLRFPLKSMASRCSASESMPFAILRQSRSLFRMGCRASDGLRSMAPTSCPLPFFPPR